LLTQRKGRAAMRRIIPCKRGTHMPHPARAPQRQAGHTPAAGHAGIDRGHPDPYHARALPSEPTWCPACGAVFENGRWQWLERPSTDAQLLSCAACERTRDERPAGIVHIAGAFAHAHHAELLALLQQHAEEVAAEQPLQRVMAIRDTDDAMQVCTTDIRLAHSLARVLQRTYRGSLQLHYGDAQVLLLAHWRR
jgi:hypothetical protein